MACRTTTQRHLRRPLTKGRGCGAAVTMFTRWHNFDLGEPRRPSLPCDCVLAHRRPRWLAQSGNGRAFGDDESAETSDGSCLWPANYSAGRDDSILSSDDQRRGPTCPRDLFHGRQGTLTPIPFGVAYIA